MMMTTKRAQEKVKFFALLTNDEGAERRESVVNGKMQSYAT